MRGPNQFELAPIFENVNLANDHNQLVMDLMKRIARKHNFAVLLHEKPYQGVNGSGKTTTGRCAPTRASTSSHRARTPKGNMLFLTFLVNVLDDGVQEPGPAALSIITSAGNSHRLGANGLRPPSCPSSWASSSRPSSTK